MRKIRVEFEIEADEVKRLIAASKKGPKVISDEELKELTKAGTIRAADYLDKDQQAAVTGFISKAVDKASAALSNKTVQSVAVSEAVDKATDKASAFVSEKPTPEAEAKGPRKR